MTVVAVSASDIITFAKGAENVADTIGNVIDTVSGDLVDDIDTFLGGNSGVTASSNSIVQGVLPHNDLLSGKAANEYRYLKSRDAALLNTLRAHLSTGETGFTSDFESLADDDNGDGSNIFTRDSNGVYTFDMGKTFKCDDAPSAIPCTTCASGVAANGGEFCVYGKNSDTGDASDSDLLIPPTARPTIGAYDATLSEVANDVPEHLKQQDSANVSTVLSLVDKNNYLVEGVTGDNWLTVFAPNEDAVTTLVTTLDDAVDGFTIDGPALTTFLTWNDYLTGNVLKGHVVEASAANLAAPTWSEDLPSSGTLPITTVLSGVEGFDGIIEYDSNDGTLKPKTLASDLEPEIVEPNVYTKDAVVHVIDNFLLTSTQVTLVVDALKRASLADAVAANTKLVEYVGKASGAIGTQLGKDVQQTLFAPVNSAFDKLSEEQGEYLEDNQDELDKVLKAHVFTGVYFAEGSETAANEEEVTLTDLNNSEIKCTKEKCTINGSEVTLKNLKTTRYGVVYDIESVIVPSDVELPSSATTMTTTIAAFMLSAMAAIALVF